MTDEPEGVGAVLNGVATQVTAELAQLRGLLEPFRDVCLEAGANLGANEEWNIAADGLFGPAGVLAAIAGALNVEWADYTDAVWADEHSRAGPFSSRSGVSGSQT
jgi:hypothetical protein